MSQFCPQCGTENLNEAKFCRACGSKITIQQPSNTALDKSNNSEKNPSVPMAIFWSVIIIAGIIYLVSNQSSNNDTTATESENTTYEQDSLPAEENKPQQYIRPDTAPNGYAWPASADYISGYAIDNSDGRCKVTVDNSQNDSDIFVKLYSLDRGESPVRHFYIPANSSFSLNDVTPGNYDVRYKDLETGVNSKTEQFQLEEIDTGFGVQYSDISLTIYKVLDGNMDTYEISESEF